jgi:hypothetical protein
MTQPDEHLPARPQLAFRVGITGARSLRADQVDRISGQLRDVLFLVKQEIISQLAKPMVSKSYLPSAPDTEPRLRILSPLARGADRLAARNALDLGYDLYVPMPFSQDEYEKDFTGPGEGRLEELPLTPEQDLGEFRELLGRASAYIALDGGRAPDPTSGRDFLSGHAYELAGRYLVRHCDLVIAVWDGRPGNGRGGTAEIVHYAATARVPIWWIHATDSEAAPLWLADIQDLRDGIAVSISASDEFRDYLGKLIPPPVWIRPRHRDLMGRIANFFREGNLSPVEAYFNELPRRRRPVWNTYSRVMAWASKGLHLPRRHRRPAPDDPAQRYWFDLQKPAGDRSGEYADRYRSSYVLVIVLTTWSLIFGALAVGCTVSSHGRFQWLNPVGGIMTIMEAIVLFGIVGLVVASMVREWHEKSIEYRILAELYRKQQTLAAVGWMLPFGTVSHLGDMEGLAWVCWLFAAAQRAAPLPHGDVTNAAQHKAGRDAVEALIAEQIEYHSDREHRSLKVSAKFEDFGRSIFVLVGCCVLVKLVFEFLVPREHLVLILGFFATVLPAVSAAFVGLRSYAEWQLLAEQSHHMIVLLQNARNRVQRLNLNRPSVSQDLGAEALSVALVMLQDVEGWGRLFRGKAMEA